jgi:hypothetical protein
MAMSEKAAGHNHDKPKLKTQTPTSDTPGLEAPLEILDRLAAGRGKFDTSLLKPQDVLALQRTIGNQAVMRMASAPIERGTGKPPSFSDIATIPGKPRRAPSSHPVSPAVESAPYVPVWHTLARAIVQRALSYGVPATQVALDTDLASNTNSVSQFTHGETLTNSWGAASSTASFTHSASSDKLEHHNVYWGPTHIGELKTGKQKGSFDPLVKMHLVNSYLHPNANSWAGNWVWGHGDLNKKHVAIEDTAKAYHPAVGTQLPLGWTKVHALSYRTDVGAHSTAGETAASIAGEIANVINTEAGRLLPVGTFTPVTVADVNTNVTIGPNSVPNFFNLWSAAIPNTVAKQISAEIRSYDVDGTGNVSSADTALGPISDSDSVNTHLVANQAAATVVPRVVLPPGTRPKRASTVGGGSSKKVKTT